MNIEQTYRRAYLSIGEILDKQKD